MSYYFDNSAEPEIYFVLFQIFYHEAWEEEDLHQIRPVQGELWHSESAQKNETYFGTIFRKTTPGSWVAKTKEANGVVEFTQINSGMNFILR